VTQSVAGRGQFARLLAGYGFGWLSRGFGWPMGLADLLGLGGPKRLLIAPQDIRTADPTMAADIYTGYFAFAGKMVSTHGRSPFETPAPSPAWAAALASFGWLRHLRAADTALSRANARALVEDWIRQSNRKSRPEDWEPRVATRRLLSWLSQSPLILEGADSAFYRLFMKSIRRQAMLLQRRLNDDIDGETRLFALIALAEFGLCGEGLDTMQERMSLLLGEELGRQVLADGGHIGRNPQTIVDLLLDLLPLRQAYSARGVSAPPQLLNAIDRMMPMLRLFRLGDGSLALFNGMGQTAPHDLATILAHDDARAAPLINAPYAGYQRMEGGSNVLIMDTGAIPPGAFSDRTHAGCLSFEFSSENQRLIVNCGSPNDTRANMREAARSTAAHSTLTLADTSSCRFGGEGEKRAIQGKIVSGPNKVRVKRQSAEDCVAMEASHDGYERQFGLIHTRSLYLSTEGDHLEGEDKLTPASGKKASILTADYAVRFHLHWSLRTKLLDDRQSVEIRTPSGQVWLFHAEGHRLAIEESISFASPEGVRGADQIVIHTTYQDYPSVNWTLYKTGG